MSKQAFTLKTKDIERKREKLRLNNGRERNPRNIGSFAYYY